MLVFRIALLKYCSALNSSGRAARWNEADFGMIYTSESRSLCCLENIVHRNKLGLSANFGLMVIDIPNDLKINEIKLTDLSDDWKEFGQMYLTQQKGTNWLKSLSSAVLKVPSSIVYDEHNYLINPNHPDFSRIKLREIKPFLFDDRIKD